MVPSGPTARIVSTMRSLYVVLRMTEPSAAATIDAIIAHGGQLVQPIGADAPEVTRRYRDPAGNVIGIYQEPGQFELFREVKQSPRRAARPVHGRAAARQPLHRHRQGDTHVRRTRARGAIRCCAGRSATTSRKNVNRWCGSSPASRICPMSRRTPHCPTRSRRGRTRFSW